MLTKLGVATHELGDEDDAERLLADAVQKAATVGSGDALIEAHISAGRLARRRGNLETARAHLHDALRLSDDHAVLDGARVHVELVHTAADAAEPAIATAHAGDALALARQVGDPRILVRLAEGLAAAIATSDHPDDAVALLASAAMARSDRGITPSRSEHEDIERVADRLRSRIDTETFDRLWTAAQRRAADQPLPTLEHLIDVHTRRLGG